MQDETEISFDREDIESVGDPAAASTDASDGTGQSPAAADWQASQQAESTGQTVGPIVGALVGGFVVAKLLGKLGGGDD